MRRGVAKSGPAFITGRKIGRVPEVRRGLQWLLAQPDGQAVIVAPTKGQYSSGDLAEVLGDAAAALASGVPVAGPSGRAIRGATLRTFRHLSGWSGGPVLLLWPDSKAVADVDDDFRVTSICVVPWTYEEIDTWASGRRAVDLSLPGSTPPAPEIADPVTAEAMASLTSRVNLGTGLTHPSDKAAAVEAFRILKRGGHQWDPAEIEAWAFDNGWSGDGVRELGEVARGVLLGRRYQVSRSGWRPDILQYWRERASKPAKPIE